VIKQISRSQFIGAALAWAGAALILALGAGVVCPEGVCHMTELDRSGLTLAHDLQSPLLDAFFAAVTYAGSIRVLLPLTLVLGAFYWWCGRKNAALFLLVSGLGARLISRLGKALIERPRPNLFPILGPLPNDASFPSGHAMQFTAFALALMLMLNARRRKVAIIPAVTLIGLVALSRVYLQVHYPSDVIAGIAVSMAWVTGLYLLLRE
jgi:membrane-associated phospholipid phosphatase